MKQQMILIVGLVILLIGIQPAPATPPPQPVAAAPSVTPTPFIELITTLQPARAPQITPIPIITVSPEPITRIIFTGDIVPGRCVAKRLIAANDFTLPYHYIGNTLRNADITVGSLDGSLTDRTEPILNCGGTMNLVGPERTVEGLTYAGFDLITLATNHIKDCGILGCNDDALFDTMNTLERNNIKSVGGGKNLNEARQPVIVERHGIRFAFLGASEIYPTYAAAENTAGFALLKSEYILQDIAYTHQIADVVIVLPHWGTEYVSTPTWMQYELGEKMINAGADLVIGNHPHWAQPVETFLEGKVIAYALGNLVMDQDWSIETQQGILFEATFRGKKLEKWNLMPYHIYDGYQPRWADPDEATAILKRINSAFDLPPLSLRQYAKR